MSFVKLEFILYVGEEALPVTDAEIIILNTDTADIFSNKVLKVDSNGKSKPVSLYTYERYLSEEPDASIKPYKTYDAIIISNTLQNKYIKNIPIFAGITSIQKVQMTPKARGLNAIDIIDIPPNGLIASEEVIAEEKIGVKNIAMEASNEKGAKILKEVVIPEYITVHLGSPNSSAQNVTVLFTDYLKNVASSEIYPTWPRAALESNIYDNYFLNGRNIYYNISEVVDDIFNEYISRIQFKEPLLAQYCNGTTVTCDGLSQWGTVSYADQGYDAFKILQVYYGNNIELRTANYEYGTIQSYPGKALRVGDSGEDVKTIQMQLNRIRKNYPEIPEITNVNGEFNEATKNAVKTFQKIFNLTQDGIVGKQTWYKISQIYVGVKKLAELNSEGEKLPLPETAPTETIRLGAEGENVKIAQYLLAVIGAFYDEILPVKITGKYDNETEESVRSFQRQFNLTVDGIIGPKTWSKLIEVYKTLEPYILDSSGKLIKYPGYVLKKGKKGESVRLIQTWLDAINSKYPFIPAVTVDGIFGDRTREAVMIFQRWAGLVDDGIVGKLTWDKLYEVYRSVV